MATDESWLNETAKLLQVCQGDRLSMMAVLATQVQRLREAMIAEAIRVAEQKWHELGVR